MTTPRSAPRASHIALGGALAAFLVSNVIHNGGGIDPAIAPAAVLAMLYVWRRARPILWGTALVVALPAFAFLRWEALGQPGAVRPFLNHVALLAAGVLAVLSVLLSMIPHPAADTESA